MTSSWSQSFLDLLLLILLLFLFLLLALALAVTLLLTSDLIRFALALGWFLCCFEVFVFTLIVIIDFCSHDLRWLSLLHNDFYLPAFKVFHKCIKFSSFDSQKLNFFFLISDANFKIELFIGRIDPIEFGCWDIIYSEVKNRLGNKDDTLFQHIQPTRLSLNISLYARLVLVRLEVVSWLNQVYICCCVEQIDEHLELRTSVFLL